jgi:hypothetical protein
MTDACLLNVGDVLFLGGVRFGLLAQQLVARLLEGVVVSPIHRQLLLVQVNRVLPKYEHKKK